MKFKFITILFIFILCISTYSNNFNSIEELNQYFEFDFHLMLSKLNNEIIQKDVKKRM